MEICAINVQIVTVTIVIVRALFLSKKSPGFDLVNFKLNKVTNVEIKYSLSSLSQKEPEQNLKVNPYGIIFTVLNILAIIVALMYYFSKR